MKLGQPVDGTFKPAELPALADFLVTDKGSVSYQLIADVVTRRLGGEHQRVQCIITGWFEVLDGLTLQPSRFPLDIRSMLVLVPSEADLPPLEEEGDDEDYIVCGPDFDIAALVQEEVLLALPNTLPRVRRQDAGLTPKSFSARSDTKVSAATGVADSPFAKLQALKKVD